MRRLRFLLAILAAITLTASCRYSHVDQTDSEQLPPPPPAPGQSTDPSEPLMRKDSSTQIEQTVPDKYPAEKVTTDSIK